MRVYRTKRHVSWQIYQRELLVVALIGIFLFLAAALISYNPHDSSWFYYTHKKLVCTNWCGTIGAHAAALLFYLCGASSFLLLVAFGFMVHMHLTNKKIADEWDRLCAFSLLTIVSATLSYYYGVDFWASPFPGGLIGVSVFQMLHQWLDVIGSMIFLYALFMMSVILVLRFSCIDSITYGVTRVHAVLSHLVRAQYGTRLYGALRRGILCMQSLMRRALTLVTEQFDDGADESVPDDAYVSLSQEVQEAVVPLVIEEEPSDQKRYSVPPLSLFTPSHETADLRIKDDSEGLAKILEEKLERFGIKGSVTAIKRGPVVTLFEYQPDIDAKLSKIISLEDDLALALRAVSIRILAPIPGKSVVGFEVANTARGSVFFAPLIQSRDYEQYAGQLPLILGEDTLGSRVIVDLAKMPHLLVAGSTGSGKSVALNGMLLSLLCKRTPQELQLILIDPKRLEFAAYADCAHLIFPIVTDPKRAAPTLAWVVLEMERRYTIMAQRSTRTIADYNGQVSVAEKLPYIVLVIDELADLMITVGKEVETALARIAQMARAAGIHMIVATQRPSVDVITGVIKVNFPSRISFRVMSKIDSRTILDCAGAEKLLGRGDMLFIDGQGSAIKRVHGAYVYDADIQRVVAHIKAEQAVVYRDVHEYGAAAAPDQEIEDALYPDVVRFLSEIDEVSISLLQRKFRIGYNRSARLIELLELQGLIMPSESGKTRKVIK